MVLVVDGRMPGCIRKELQKERLRGRARRWAFEERVEKENGRNLQLTSAEKT